MSLNTNTNNAMHASNLSSHPKTCAEVINKNAPKSQVTRPNRLLQVHATNDNDKMFS